MRAFMLAAAVCGAVIVMILMWSDEIDAMQSGPFDCSTDWECEEKYGGSY